MFDESEWRRGGTGRHEEHDEPEYWGDDSGYRDPERGWSAQDDSASELRRLLSEVPPHHDGPAPDGFRH